MNIARHMLITTLLTSIFCSASRSYAEAATLPAPLLCPVVDTRPFLRLQQSQETITAPQTAEERQRRLQQLTSGEASRRYTAIIALAFAGDLGAFQQLLASKKASDIQTFALYYHNSDNTRCLAPEVETLIIHHLDDPAIARSLFAFFTKNFYRSRELFDALIAHRPHLIEVRAYPKFVRALTATNLPDIAPQILAQATAFSTSATLKLASPVLETQKAYVTYFVRRRDASVLDYIETLLNTLHKQETTQLQSYAYAALTNMRADMYRALAQFPSARAAEISLKEVERLTHDPWRRGMTTLLTLLAKALDTPAATAAQRDRAVQHIADMLQTNPPLPGHQARHTTRPRHAPTDYEMRQHSYQILVMLNTPAATDVLLDDLHRVLALPDAGRPQALLTRLLETLRSIPATTALDIPRLLQAAAKLDASSRFHYILDILAQHPHPEAYAYLLSLLEQVVHPKDDPTVKGLRADRRTHQRVRRRVYAQVLDLLLHYDTPAELSRTRQHIDQLHARDLLKTQRYVATSKRLNALLGDESAQYLAYREQQRIRREEDTRRKQQQYFDGLRAKYHLGKYATPETIRRDIQALSTSGGVRKIKRRLIVAGPDVLPAVHAALGRPDTSSQARFHLIDVLSAIGDPRSVRPIIEVVRAEPALYRSAMLALGKLPQTAEAFDFASQQLTQPQDPKRQSSALIYFAFHREQRAYTWAQQFSSPTTHPDVRAAAVYLAARLGDRGAKPIIIELLQTQQKQSQRTFMLRALAEIARVDEFKTLTAQLAINQQTRDYRSTLVYVEFMQASGEDKTAFAETLLTSRDALYPSQGARYLIAQNRMDVLGKYLTGAAVYHLPLDLAVMQSPKAALIVVEARRMGYRFEETAEGLRLLKRDD